jgi:hypothetical protein
VSSCQMAAGGGVKIGTPDFWFRPIGWHGMFVRVAPACPGVPLKARPAMRPFANSFLVSRLARVRG